MYLSKNQYPTKHTEVITLVIAKFLIGEHIFQAESNQTPYN